MFINIANQNALDPDPVDQMITEFQSFRDSLEGKADAVQTRVITPKRILIDDPGETKNIRIEIRDWESNLIDSSATFTLDYNPKHLTLGLPAFVSPGVYDIPVSALSTTNAAPGRHSIKIQATTTTDLGPHTVTLMPRITIATTNSLADYNADAVHDFADISLFVRAFRGADLIADLNTDPILDQQDIAIFLDAYKSAP